MWFPFAPKLVLSGDSLYNTFLSVVSELQKDNCRICDVRQSREAETGAKRTIFYTGYEILNEELLLKDLVELNGNQFVALEPESSVSDRKFLFIKNDEKITAIHLGKNPDLSSTSPRKVPIPNCQRFGVTFMDTTIIYKIESFDMTNPNFKCYLEIDSAGYVCVFRQLSDGTTDEVHGVVFGHKKHKRSPGTLPDIEKFIKYLRRIL